MQREKSEEEKVEGGEGADDNPEDVSGDKRTSETTEAFKRK